MNVSCPECRSIFRVDPSKLPAMLVRARCSVCGGVITISEGSSIEDDFAARPSSAPASPQVAPRAVSTASSAAVKDWKSGSEGQAGASELATALRGAGGERVERPSPGPGVLDRAARAGSTVVAEGEESSPPPGPTRPAESAPAPAASNAQPTAPVGAVPSAKGSQSRPVLFPPRPMMPGGGPGPVAQGSSRPAATQARPLTPPTAAPRVPGAQSLSRPSTASAPVSPSPNAAPVTAPPAVAQGSAQVTGTPARAPINPFLANDPHAKAKRLARALVSDLVTYFPQKCEEGLRDGTLKQLFKDEIQKSYEEYVLQVGREFAETTPHFQDALNDILARGQKVF